MRHNFRSGTYTGLILSKRQFPIYLIEIVVIFVLSTFCTIKIGFSMSLPYGSFKSILSSAIPIMHTEDAKLSSEILGNKAIEFFTGFNPQSPSTYMQSIGNIFSFIVPENADFKENFSEKLIMSNENKYKPLPLETSAPKPTDAPIAVVPDTTGADSGVTTPTPPLSEKQIAIAEQTKVKGSALNFVEFGGISVTNLTSHKIDAKTILNASLKLKLDKEGPKVLIMHTHSTESYAPNNSTAVDTTFTGRSINPFESVLEVGNIITDVLIKNGIETVHDETLHDYPSYTGSYNRAMKTIDANLKKYPSIEVVIDVHRDAVNKSDGSPIKYTTMINNEKVAQVMMVMGNSEGGLKHPNWQDNLGLSFKIQSKMNDLYPTLAKPIIMRKERFNEHATLGSFILEVGTYVNSLEEAKKGAEYAAEAISAVLGNISK